MLSKRFNLISRDSIKPFKKVIKVDSDKSLSIRSFLIGAISQDVSKIKNVLESDDVFSTINCLKKLGIKIKREKPGFYNVYGKGLGSFFAKKNNIFYAFKNPYFDLKYLQKPKKGHFYDNLKNRA